MVVLCHGAFDFLHFGHLLLFQHARKLAGNGQLVVTLTADRFVAKGPGRPIFRENERAAMIRAIAIIDQVEICNGASGVLMIKRHKPDIYLKHSEYRTKDERGFLEDEKRMVEALGGKVEFWAGPKWSSSEIIRRIASWKEAQPA